MTSLISFAALFLSIMMMQLSSGGVGPLDALVGLEQGFSRSQVGLLGSAHFLGFFIGCWWAPRMMGRVGHSRAFAAFTAMGAIGLIGHTLMLDPTAWAVLRVASGLSIAGCYTIVDAWLQAKVTNANRGRTMGIYRSTDLGAQLIAQGLIGLLAGLETYMAYNLLALIACASLLPLTLTQASPPVLPAAPKLDPMLALRRSPLAVLAVIVAGLTGAAFRMVGPIYGAELGLSPGQIGLFLAAFVAGGALAQYPVGWLADSRPRRTVLIWLSLAAIASSALTVAIAHLGTTAVMLSAALFGLTTYPVYSVATAHAHDFASDDERVELSAALVFLFAIGAIAAPLITSRLIDLYGPPALFAFIAVGHVVLAGYGLARMRVRPSPEQRTRYTYAPRTSFLIGRITGRLRSGGRDDDRS